MTDRGFESDAVFFEIAAQHCVSAADQTELRNVAQTYRTLSTVARSAQGKSRRELWQDRAEECRVLSEQFTSQVCREQLHRLAQAYEQMASHEPDVRPAA